MFCLSIVFCDEHWHALQTFWVITWQAGSHTCYLPSKALLIHPCTLSEQTLLHVKSGFLQLRTSHSSSPATEIPSPAIVRYWDFSRAFGSSCPLSMPGCSLAWNQSCCWWSCHYANRKHLVKENATERGGGVKTTKELSKRRTGMSLSTTCFGRTLALHVSLKTPKNFCKPMPITFLHGFARSVTWIVLLFLLSLVSGHDARFVVQAPQSAALMRTICGRDRITSKGLEDWQIFFLCVSRDVLRLRTDCPCRA